MQLQNIIREIEQNRVRLTDTLIAFVKTDTVLFAFDKQCADYFSPFAKAANTVLNTVFTVSMGLEIAESNLKQDGHMQVYLEKLPMWKFALLYLAAVQGRSVLLGVLFAEGKVNVDEFFKTAFYEELYQQGKWGTTAETEKKYELIKTELSELEQLRDEKSLFEN